MRAPAIRELSMEEALRRRFEKPEARGTDDRAARRSETGRATAMVAADKCTRAIGVLLPDRRSVCLAVPVEQTWMVEPWPAVPAPPGDQSKKRMPFLKCSGSFRANGHGSERLSRNRPRKQPHRPCRAGANLYPARAMPQFANPAHKVETTEAGPPAWRPDKTPCPKGMTLAERTQPLPASTADIQAFGGSPR